MNYDYGVKWFKYDKLTSGLKEHTDDGWEPISHSYDSSDHTCSILFRRSKFLEDITGE